MSIKSQFIFIVIFMVVIPICILMYYAIFKWNDDDFNENSTKKEGDNNDNR
jgi:hypothetical protein